MLTVTRRNPDPARVGVPIIFLNHFAATLDHVDPRGVTPRR